MSGSYAIPVTTPDKVASRVSGARVDGPFPVAVR